MSLQKFKEDFILFSEAGFIAINQSDEDAAVKLFKAAALLKPENTLPKVGLGYMHLCKLELKAACKAFEEVLAIEPNNEMARTFLGLAMALTPTEVSKGEKLLAESAKKSHDPMLKGLAETAIAFVEKFVKKGPTPTQGMK